jgi:hypothetical protein
MSALAYKLDIMSRTWVVKFLTKAQFIKKYSDTTLAIAECDEREIYLRLDKLNEENVSHELTHAYVHEHSAPTMDLTADQMEELCCDIVAKYATKIIEQSSQIIHAYKVLRGRRVR